MLYQNWEARSDRKGQAVRVLGVPSGYGKSIIMLPDVAVLLDAELGRMNSLLSQHGGIQVISSGFPDSKQSLPASKCWGSAAVLSGNNRVDMRLQAVSQIQASTALLTAPLSSIYHRC